MEMASRILQSFRRRRRRSDEDATDVVPATPEELEMRLRDIAPAAAYELQKRRHWTPEMVAREAEKQRWVAEQKHLIAELKRLWRRGSSASGASSVVDVVLDGSISLDKALGEEFERWFFEELRLHAAAPRSSDSAATMDSSKVDHDVVVVTEDEDEDEHVPAHGDEGYLERRRELLGRYCLTPARRSNKAPRGGRWRAAAFLITRLGRRTNDGAAN